MQQRMMCPVNRPRQMQAAWHPALVTDGETEGQVQSGASDACNYDTSVDRKLTLRANT
jgi:hypothetical protein